MGYSDTDVAEYLYNKKPQIEPLTDLLCNKLSKACTTKPPPVPKVICIMILKLIILHVRFCFLVDHSFFSFLFTLLLHAFLHLFSYIWKAVKT